MTHFDRTLLIHVAAERERRGRVVLASRTAVPHAAAVDAAMAMASAFETWVECLLIESPDVLALTQHTFARTVSHAGRIAPLSQTVLAEAQSGATKRARNVMRMAGQRCNVRVETTIVQDGIADALARACAVEGPWNLMALAEPVQPSDSRWLCELLAEVNGATGIVCAGTSATPPARRGNAVVVVVEDIERLPQMLRAAERLAHDDDRASGARPILLLIAGETAEKSAQLDGHLRLLMADLPVDPAATIGIAEAGVAHGTPIEIAEALRRQNAHVVILRCGGIALPANGDAAPLLAVVSSPMLVVR
jgi:hypothetical protein